MCFWRKLEKRMTENSTECMLVNARSLDTRTVNNLLNILFVDEKIDVCCITETWLKPGDQSVLADIKLRGYEIISSPRAKNKKGGEGVAFLCKNYYKYKERKSSKFNFLKI